MRIRQLFLNMKLIAELEGGEYTLRDAVRLVAYVTDMGRRGSPATRCRRNCGAGAPYPPRTIVEVARLNQDDIFEIEGTFYAPR